MIGPTISHYRIVEKLGGEVRNCGVTFLYRLRARRASARELQ